jgi:hypothetical protein
MVPYYLFGSYRIRGCLLWLKVRADLRKLSERQFLIATAAGVKNPKIFFEYLLEPGMTMGQARHPRECSGFIYHFSRELK